MKVYVTGASGYLGRELVRIAPEIRTERVEIRDSASVRSLFERVRPELVIHTAYRQDGPEAWETNVDGSRNVARAAAAVGARLVQLSSDVVFGGRKDRPYVEEDEPDPVNEYGRSKADAERAVREESPRALLVRTSLIYGGADPSKHELAARAGGAWFTNEIRSPVQVGDLARAVLELARTAAAGPLHVAGADPVSRAAFAELIVGHPVETAEAPPSRPLDCRLDSSRAQAMIRTRLRGVREVLG